MYVDTTTAKRGDKVYTRHLLRTSFRLNGKVKHKTLLNLSACSDKEIAAIKLALKHKADLTALAPLSETEVALGKSFGAVWAALVAARRVGLTDAVGDDLNAKRAMMQVVVRLIDQGSRLSAVRFAMRHAVCEILGINKLNEDDLYKNLAWLAENQEAIEKRLFKKRFPGDKPTLFLYDVTSSYLEGEHNELACWGYNRDKKNGKKQIVVGLLAGPDGLPIAVRVFEGNTSDTKTVAAQIKILADGYGVKNVTLVGDRGMLKGPQIEQLPDDFRYITAISKPQIQKMLTEGVLQYELFAEHVCEVQSDGVRYVLRRNCVRARQIAETRNDKHTTIVSLAKEQTEYLAKHPRAKVDKALEKVEAKIKKIRADAWLTVSADERCLRIEESQEKRSQVALLDGCYVIKSDVPKQDADAQTLHDRYCDLETVERAFRTIKTTHLELRPIYVTKEASTKGHAFVVMLALVVQRYLEKAWLGIDATVQEGFDELAAINLHQVTLRDVTVQNIPKPTALGQQLLAAADITLPPVFPMTAAIVATKKKLPSDRKSK